VFSSRKLESGTYGDGLGDLHEMQDIYCLGVVGGQDQGCTIGAFLP
jgi:hypothetical protein